MCDISKQIIHRLLHKINCLKVELKICKSKHHHIVEVGLDICTKFIKKGKTTMFVIVNVILIPLMLLVVCTGLHVNITCR